MYYLKFSETWQKKSNISQIESWRTMFRRWPFFCPRNLFQAKMFRFYAIFKNKNLHIWGIFVYEFTNLRKYADPTFPRHVLATVSSWEQWCCSGSGNNKKNGTAKFENRPRIIELQAEAVLVLMITSSQMKEYRKTYVEIVRWPRFMQFLVRR